MVVPEGSTIVDVGAHKGLYSIPLHGMGCSIYAFEPNSYCAALLRGWAAGKNRVHVFNVGLSDTSGTAEMKIPVDDAGRKHIASASVCKEFEGKFTIEEITLRRLDEFDLASLSFLKIDVEGLEDKVIRGGIETIRKHRPIMLIEIEERHRSTHVNVVFDMIYQLGYRAFQRVPSGFREILQVDVDDFAGIASQEISKNFWFIHNEADCSFFTGAEAS
jgi:FkbM family methyltransferase